MARRSRVQIPGAVYHVYSRGNRKDQIFDDDIDRESLMGLVAHVHRRYEARFYGVCLMGTHYHAVLETPRGNLSETMRQMNGVFTQITNKRHGRTGHLFEGRFGSLIVERERYLRRVIRYLARNPVEAGLVTEVEAWPWSSYRATAGLDPCPAWLTTEWMPWTFDCETLSEAQTRFQRYVKSNRTKPLTIDWNKVAYGTPEFEAALTELSKRRYSDRRLPRTPRVTTPPPLHTVFLEVESVQHRDRLIEVAHVKYGYPLADISRHLGLHVGVAAKALRRVENAERSKRLTEC